MQFVYSADSISADPLRGFFVGWPNPPSPETHLAILRRVAASLQPFYVRLGMQPARGMMLRRYDRQSGA